jgi:hypothetical protein
MMPVGERVWTLLKKEALLAVCIELYYPDSKSF